MWLELWCLQVGAVAGAELLQASLAVLADAQGGRFWEPFAMAASSLTMTMWTVDERFRLWTRVSHRERERDLATVNFAGLEDLEALEADLTKIEAAFEGRAPLAFRRGGRPVPTGFARSSPTQDCEVELDIFLREDFLPWSSWSTMSQFGPKLGVVAPLAFRPSPSACRWTVGDCFGMGSPSLSLAFDQSIILMSLSVVPSILMCMLQFIFHSLGELSHLLSFLGVSLLAFKRGIAPAFFRRVDHPLHWLDRIRWITCCCSYTALVVISSSSNGPVYAYACLWPIVHTSLTSFSSFGLDHQGAQSALVQLPDARLDMSRVGAAAHCSDCSAKQCMFKDCRAPAGLPDVSGRKDWGFNQADTLSGKAEDRGGSSCSITCVFAVPIVAASNSSSTPLAWAIQSGLPPQEDQSVLTGATRFSWWVGAREAYQVAMDEVISLQVPRRFRHCTGQEPLLGSAHWVSKCSSRGFVNCRGARLAGSCCCPVGFQIHGGVCKACGGFAEHVSTLHQLPYRMHHERQIVATAWRKRPRPEPEEVFASWLDSGGRLVHLRQAVADAFNLEFESVGLVEGTEPLPPEKDFHSLQHLGLTDTPQLTLIRCASEGTRRAKLADRLRVAPATVANFGDTYTQGWTCHGCEAQGPADVGLSPAKEPLQAEKDFPSAEEIFPLCREPILGLQTCGVDEFMVPAPGRPEPFLQRLYGVEWTGKVPFARVEQFAEIMIEVVNQVLARLSADALRDMSHSGRLPEPKDERRPLGGLWLATPSWRSTTQPPRRRQRPQQLRGLIRVFKLDVALQLVKLSGSLDPSDRAFRWFVQGVSPETVEPHSVAWMPWNDEESWTDYMNRVRQQDSMGVVAGSHQLGLRVRQGDPRLQSKPAVWLLDRVPSGWQPQDVLELLMELMFSDVELMEKTWSRVGTTWKFRATRTDAQSVVQGVIAAEDGDALEMTATKAAITKKSKGRAQPLRQERRVSYAATGQSVTDAGSSKTFGPALQSEADEDMLDTDRHHKKPKAHDAETEADEDAAMAAEPKPTSDSKWQNWLPPEGRRVSNTGKGDCLMLALARCRKIARFPNILG
ncbi:hypothetical protein AK812_SmicGene36673 [Symbiodinium microadriaticum]|uniref:Uncharacterized protein n=1 Tax=Symbiodinium microadriaticum TaxID=2951 RepID=A0A1Q9CI94_SYMMI|nr:hypothetical protein AK812_SmicGene36673 [Symbiodinium microadriaticum]